MATATAVMINRKRQIGPRFSWFRAAAAAAVEAAAEQETRQQMAL